MTNYEARLTKIQSEYEKKLYDLAKVVRTKRIIPLCKKHNLLLKCTQSPYFFKDWVLIEFPEDAAAFGLPVSEFQEVFHILALKVRGGLFGDYVNDVTKEDLAKS